MQKGLFPADYDFSGHPTRLSEDKVKKVVPLVSYDIDYWKIYIDDKRVPPTLSLGKTDHVVATVAPACCDEQLDRHLLARRSCMCQVLDHHYVTFHHKANVTSKLVAAA